MTNKALIAMSGGVDSSVAAFLTKDMGYDATGITLKLFVYSALKAFTAIYFLYRQYSTKFTFCK